MNIADKAVKNALQCECKKDGLKQLQSGEWTLALKVHPADVPAPLLTAAMGTRYMAVLVEINDDETPVDQPTDQKPDDKHRLSRQAAMCCSSELFWSWLAEEGGTRPKDQEEAARIVRNWCQVQSRSEFDTNPEAAAGWRNLHAEFEGWKIS